MSDPYMDGNLVEERKRPYGHDPRLIKKLRVEDRQSFQDGVQDGAMYDELVQRMGTRIKNMILT